MLSWDVYPVEPNNTRETKISGKKRYGIPLNAHVRGLRKGRKVK